MSNQTCLFPQIALATGVLTSSIGFADWSEVSSDVCMGEGSQIFGFVLRGGCRAGCRPRCHLMGVWVRARRF